MQFNSGGFGWGRRCGTASWARPPVSATPPHFRGGTCNCSIL